MGDAGDDDVPRWRQLALNHRKKQFELIPPEWRLVPSSIPSPTDQANAVPFIEAHLSPQEIEITSPSLTLQHLQALIKSRKYSAVQVTSAFCHRAALLQQLTGCLTEIFFSSALETAKAQDDILSTTNQTVGPLHGIPISIKDNQDIAGIDSTLGWVGLINHPAPTSTPIVETLGQAGAILYCKTNIPQSLMMSDSYNHVYGQSVNSINRHLISGGSSGGEAALVGGGGSIVGIGTDIGGSIRIPATLQGLYGLSPSIGRVGNRESIRRDKFVVPPVSGPLACDIESVDTFMAAYLSQKPWLSDPAVLPIPWREDIVREYEDVKKPLKVAYVTDDGVIRCQPPVVRAVEETVSKFRKAGSDVIEWNGVAQKLHKRAYDLWLRAVLADGGERFVKMCEMCPGGEPLIEGMLVGKPENKLDTDGRMELYEEIVAFQREYMKIWNEAGVDALIMPVTQWVGLKPKMWVKADMYVGYTSIFNLLNWTALAIPAVKVSRELDKTTEEWTQHKARSFSDEFNHDRYEELFDQGLLDGMPVGVQIVTNRLEEEKAVGVAKLLAKLQ